MSAPQLGARLMQFAPNAAAHIEDPSADAVIDVMANVLKAPSSAFSTDMRAAFEGGDASFFERLHAIAMVVPEGLAAIAAGARASRGAVLEIGPYVGASTIAIAHALRDTNRPFFTIESGGQSTHATRGSDDILRDLKANVTAAGAAERVTIVEAWAQEACETLAERLGGEKVGLFFVDADGAVDEHLNSAKHMLHEDCLLVFDDWRTEVKGDRVRRVVEALLTHGAITEFGVVGDTWFGRMKGEAGLRMLSAEQPFAPEQGHAFWAAPVYPPTPSDDSSGDRSTLILCEDGAPLGPSYAPHIDIRTKGRGAFSHWRGRILFSTSDNSDPRTNGRRYTARYDGVEAELNRP